MKYKQLIAIAAMGTALSAPAAAETVVSLPRFEAVSLQGGGRVILRHGSQQKVTIVQGDPNVTRFSVDDRSLAIEACENNCPASYRLVVEVVSPSLSALAIQGGGTIEAQGAFPDRGSLALSIQGGGTIDAQAIDARQVAASVVGGGNIRTKATKSLAASVRGGGNITYTGSPSVATSIRGGGNVRPASETSFSLPIRLPTIDRETTAGRCLPVDAIRA